MKLLFRLQLQGVLWTWHKYV